GPAGGLRLPAAGACPFPARAGHAAVRLRPAAARGGGRLPAAGAGGPELRPRGGRK
ncbi:unnamed protein product, partial [Prorocentrum cordatum]